MNFLNVLGTRFKTVDSHHTAIFKGMLTVALFTLLGKLMSAAKEMAVAYRYGLAAEVDAYQFIYNLVSWPIGIWTSVLTAVLVPLAARMRAFDHEAIPHFRSELFGFALIIGCASVVLAWTGIAALLSSGTTGLPPHSVQLAQAALPGLVLLLPFGMLIALQSAWMLSAGRHVNTLLDSVPTLFIAAAVLVFASPAADPGISPAPSPGISPLVWGTVVGAGFHLLSLMIPNARHSEFEAPAFRRAAPHWTPFWQGFGIMLAGQALISFTVIIDQFYAVGLGTGSVATLGYANRVLSLILSLAAIAVSRATLPIFSRSASGDQCDIYRVAMVWMRLMFMAGIVAMVAGYVFAPGIIRLLFERGQFGAGDTQVVADALRFGLPQLPCYFSVMVLVSYALSQRRYKLIFWSGVIGCAGKVIGNILLVPALGINGIALAATFVYGFNAVFFCLSLRVRR